MINLVEFRINKLKLSKKKSELNAILISYILKFNYDALNQKKKTKTFRLVHLYVVIFASLRNKDDVLSFYLVHMSIIFCFHHVNNISIVLSLQSNTF